MDMVPLETNNQYRCKYFKIEELVHPIHGYGSTGKGGALRTGLRDYLKQLKRAKIIADFVPGEDWSAFDETTRKVLDLDDDFRKDTDLGKMNAGVTIIVISWDDTQKYNSEYRPTRN